MGDSPRIRLIQQSMLLVAIVIGGAVPTFGQQARQLLGRRFWQQGGVPGYPSLVSLPTPPRELERILAKADRAMQNGQYAEAIEYLDGLLRRSDLGDFLIAEPDAEYADASFRDAALDLLARLPEAGRELYELERGAEARKQLNQALQTGDLGLLGALRVNRCIRKRAAKPRCSCRDITSTSSSRCRHYSCCAVLNRRRKLTRSFAMIGAF